MCCQFAKVESSNVLLEPPVSTNQLSAMAGQTVLNMKTNLDVVSETHTPQNCLHIENAVIRVFEVKHVRKPLFLINLAKNALFDSFIVTFFYV